MNIIIILTFPAVEFCSLGLDSNFPFESLPKTPANEYLMHGTPLNKPGGMLLTQDWQRQCLQPGRRGEAGAPFRAEMCQTRIISWV